MREAAVAEAARWRRDGEASPTPQDSSTSTTLGKAGSRPSELIGLDSLAAGPGLSNSGAPSKKQKIAPSYSGGVEGVAPQLVGVVENFKEFQGVPARGINGSLPSRINNPRASALDSKQQNRKQNSKQNSQGNSKENSKGNWKGNMTAPTRANTSEPECGAIYNPQDYADGPGSFQKLTFTPEEHKYLLMYCVRGQISNRVLCQRSHLILAALLNRTLIVPNRMSEQYGKQYDLRLVWDLDRTRRCLGKNSIMTTEEYEKKFKQKVIIDRLHCWHGPAASCPNEPRLRDLDCPAKVPTVEALTRPEKAPNRTWSRPLFVDKDSHLQSHFLDLPPSEEEEEEGKERGRGMPARGSCFDYVVNHTEIVDEYKGFNDSILAVGDLVDRSVAFPGVPKAYLERIFVRGESLPPRVSSSTPECSGGKGVCRKGCRGRPLHAPPDALFRKAEEIARGLFGAEGVGNFLSVHWRRGDFGWFCFQAKHSTQCFYPPDQAANCTIRQARKYGMRHIFLATNAEEGEVKRFLEYIKAHGGGEMVVKRFPPKVKLDPQWLKAENITQQRILVEVLLDKLVAAHGKVFLGTGNSTFSEDIIYFRYGMGNLSCKDTFLCHREEEWPTDTELPEDFKKEKAEWIEKRERQRLEALDAAEKQLMEEIQQKNRAVAMARTLGAS